VIQLRGVSKAYDTPAGPFIALREIDLEVGVARGVRRTGGFRQPGSGVPDITALNQGGNQL
jgi:hypothetical protein